MRAANLCRTFVGWLVLLSVAAVGRGADPLTERARDVLRRAFQEEKGWTRIHAAEALLVVSDAETVRKEFGEPVAAEGARPERIGIWRVRAALAQTPEERTRWVRQIEAVAVDAAAKDQLQGIESLAKLGERPGAAVLAAAHRLAEKGDAESLYPMWLEHLAGDTGAVKRIARRLSSPVPAARLRAAYVLRKIKPDDPEVRQALAHAAGSEPPETMAYPFVLGAALLLGADPAQAAGWRATLEKLATTSAAGARYEADQVLMQVRPAPDEALFRPGLDGTGDVRIGAAWAILALAGRR